MLSAVLSPPPAAWVFDKSLTPPGSRSPESVRTRSRAGLPPLSLPPREFLRSRLTLSARLVLRKALRSCLTSSREKSFVCSPKRKLVTARVALKPRKYSRVDLSPALDASVIFDASAPATVPFSLASSSMSLDLADFLEEDLPPSPPPPPAAPPGLGDWSSCGSCCSLTFLLSSINWLV